MFDHGLGKCGLLPSGLLLHPFQFWVWTIDSGQKVCLYFCDRLLCKPSTLSVPWQEHFQHLCCLSNVLSGEAKPFSEHGNMYLTHVTLDEYLCSYWKYDHRFHQHFISEG